MKQDNVALEKENASLPVELASLEFKVKEELELVKLQQAGIINLAAPLSLAGSQKSRDS